MTNHRQNPSWGKAAKFGAEAGLVLAYLFLQFRLLTFSIIALMVVLLVSFPAMRVRRWLFSFAAVVVISMFLPFDVALGSFHYGSRRGTSSGGPHFVRFVVGMPRHTQLIERYGEYITGGCGWPVMYPPRTILVWD